LEIVVTLLSGKKKEEDVPFGGYYIDALHWRQELGYIVL
jgi:hypothetical protein